MKRLLLLLTGLAALTAKAQTLTVTASPVSNVTCNGANNGTATINVSGCPGPYTYLLDGNPVPNGNLTGLTPGSHTVDVSSPATTGSDTLFFDNFEGALKWTLNTNIGSQGGTPNLWVINAASPYGGSCSPNAGNNSMHITCGGGFACSLFAPNGEAAYNASGAASVTDRFTSVINDISTVGRTNVQVKFTYVSNGQANTDYGNLRYSIDGGTNWVDINTNYQSTTSWTCAVVTLPVACENIPNLKIAFRWRNNASAGSDPPFNIDNVLVRADGGGSGGPGCTGSVTFNITQPSTPLSVSIANQTNVLCNGASTGAVTVAGAGGTTNYQYKIGNGALQSSGTFTGLAAGTYTVTVQDANNCTSTVQVTITQPSTPLSVSISSQTPTNCGGSTGSVTVAGAGGTAAYQYKLDNGPLQSSGTFSGLAAGVYTVTVQDANNCTSTVQVTIVSPSGLTVSTQTQTNVLCFGNSTGSVTVAGANGAPSYQYKIGNGPLQSSGTFSGLAAGTYTITVQDANNCTSTVQVTITQPSAPLSVSISNQTNVLCNGASTGSVTVAGAGGTTAYQYKIGNGALQSSGTFSGLAGGTYTITVQDANNCTSTVQVTITQPSTPLSVSISNQTNILCNGANTGSVTVAGAGGTTAYQYKIGNGALQSSGTFSGLTAGTYTITVQDANSCTSTVQVTITQPATPLSVSTSNQTNVLCFGNSTGSVTVAGAGGTANYQYKIGNGPLQSSGTFSGLAAGTYTITVQDANNCTSTVQVTITQPSSAVSVSVSSQTPTNCGGSTGSVTVAGSGGTTAYQYKIGNGALQNSPTFSNLAAGTYTITIQDANGCTATTSVTISNPSGLTVSTQSQTNVLCFGGNTGSVTVAGANGTPSYQYKIGNGPLQSSGTFNGLTAGTYTITVQDGANCTSTVSVTITQPNSAVSGSIVSQTNATCGTSTGSVTIAGAGGTPNYDYQLGNGPLQQSGVFTGLAPATYTFTIYDDNGCTTTLPVTITGTSSVVASATPTAVGCNGQTNGSITASGTGGTNVYTYSLDGIIFQQSNTFSNLSPGPYVVTVSDNQGCTDTVHVTITEPLPYVPTTDVTGDVNVCQNDPITITVTSPGSNACSWSNGATGNSITVSAGGVYSVTCQDGNGCTGTSNDINVTLVNLPVALFNSQQIDNYNVEFTNTSTGNGTYVWTFPGNQTSTETNPTFNFPSEGNYSVMLVATNECGSDTLTQVIGVEKINGVNEYDVLSSFNLFPNPANGSANIKMAATQPVKGQLRILTIQGKVVYEENVNFNASYAKTIDVSTLSGGIYIVTLVTDKVNISRKLTIEK